MARLPIVQHVEVTGYQLYPGSPDDAGLARDIEHGITLIVGANGLGKTTLLTLMRDLCAGPFRLRARGGASFGAGALTVTSVESDRFAVRVSDGAQGASATLEMRVGSRSIRVTRSLSDLRLMALTADGTDLNPAEEEFQRLVVSAADLGSYGDWLLLIDHLSFITEDRFLPFWDKDVQRHLLRVVANAGSLPADLAAAEDALVSADSDYRNAVFQRNRYRERYDRQRAKQSDEPNVLAELEELASADSRLKADLAEAREAMSAAEEAAERSVRDAEMGESKLLQARDAFEVGRLQHIDAAIPGADDVTRFVLARVKDANLCPLCLREWAADLAESSKCRVCGQDGAAPALDAGALTSLELDVAHWSESVEGARSAADAATEEVRQRAREIYALDAAIAKGADRSRRLQAKLPADSQAAATLKAVLDGLQADVEELDGTRVAAQHRLATLTEQSNASVLEAERALKEIFDKLATLFLVERCELVAHERGIRVGQVGPALQVRSFDVNLHSATSAGESRRASMTEVSESQRVYIDIAFRIAMIAACTNEGEGTLVMDAPEGSLDAVFTDNAAALLASFLEYSPENRLVVATNLIEGSLLPSLARLAGIDTVADTALIDLLTLAAPTAAVENNRGRYQEILEHALHPQGGLP